ncbi:MULTISPECIES: hypothetical protein [Natrialbaceae]|uniref:hypothetical protein n=1 Tax=Natrialbaceae TaxID=1644061 RepID=UPI00207C4D3D|nr:hypothetical protein [Natronococcus sp. CG52]
MVSSRAVTAIVGLGAGLAVSVIAWIYLDTFLLFLFLPFVPFLFPGGSRGTEPEREYRRCPRCGFETTDPDHEYCPRDGERLRERTTDDRGGVR